MRKLRWFLNEVRVGWRQGWRQVHTEARGGAIPGSRADSDSVPMRLSYGEVHCPRCDVTVVGNEADPDAREAFRAHLRLPPHTTFGKWRSDA
jgi:hypothetical protein